MDSRVSLVLFDLDDTLCDYSGARDGRLRRAFGHALSAAHGSDPDDLDTQLLDRLIAESIAIHPHGADHFAELLSRHGVADAEVAEMARRWYVENRFHGLQLFAEALEVLSAVRATGRRIGLVTNGPAEVQRDKIGLLGLWPHIDFAVISGEVGIEKPDPAIFQEALRQGQAEPEETIFIGDSPEHDIAGAHAAGIHAVWISRAGTPWSTTGIPPHRLVSALTELLEDRDASR